MGLQFPSVDDLMDLFVKSINPPKDEDNALAVVVIGIDEVQALNNSKTLTIGEDKGRVGLGRLFLNWRNKSKLPYFTRTFWLCLSAQASHWILERTDQPEITQFSLDKRMTSFLSASLILGILHQQSTNPKRKALINNAVAVLKRLYWTRWPLWWPRVCLIETWTPYEDVGSVPTDGNISS